MIVFRFQLSTLLVAAAFALALASLTLSSPLRAAESTQAGTADIDYTRRVLLPSGHSPGIVYASDPSSPALFLTTTDFYSLNLATGGLSGPTSFNNSVSLSPGVALGTYAAGIGIPVVSVPIFFAYSQDRGIFPAISTVGQVGSLFGGSPHLFYVTVGAKITSYSVAYDFVHGTPAPVTTLLYTIPGLPSPNQSLYVSATQIATLLMGNQVYRVDLSTGTALTNFTVTGSFANSLTVDSEGNSYVGNNQGGAYVYSTSGTLLGSFTPGANDPTDANIGTVRPYLFLNTAGQLVVMDSTGMHQYRVFTPVPVTSTADSGAGTLRQAISDVANGVLSAKSAKFDTIFDTPQTITLTSSLDTLGDSVGAGFSLAPPTLLTVDSGAATFLDLAGSGLVYSLANIRSVSTSADAIKVRNGAILSAASTFAFDRLTLDGGIFRTTDTYASTGAVSLGASGGAFDATTATATLSGVLSGSGALTKTGAGTLALTGANTFSGGLAINGGTVSINNTSAFGTGPLSLDGGTLTTTTDLVLTKDTTLNAGGGTFAHSNGFFTLNGNVTGTGGLTKTGTNILTLSGAHTYSGATTVAGGTLKFGANGATASTVATSGLAIASGAKVIFADSQTYAGDVTGAGVLEHEFSGTTILTGAASHTGGTNIIGGTIQLGNGGSTGSLAGSVVLSSGGTLAFNRSDVLTYSGAVTGTGSLAQLGSGTLTLDNTNVFANDVALNAGTLALGSSGAIGTTGTISFNGGTLQFGANNTTDYSARFSTAASQAYQLDTNGRSVTLAGNLTSSGGTLTKSGAGTLTLSGVNTYSGTTTINAGTLALSGGSALPDNAAVVLANTTGATLALSSSETIGSLAGGGTAGGNVDLGSFTLTTGGSNGSTAFAGVISGSGSVLKIGNGTLTLTGANTYTGGTTVTGGTLALSGAGSVGSAFTVNSGGTLDLGGKTISYPVTMEGGTVRNGTLAINAMVLHSGILAANIQETGTNGTMMKTTTGTLTLSGNITLSGFIFIKGGTILLGSADTGTARFFIDPSTGLDPARGLNTSTYDFDLSRVQGLGGVKGSGVFHATTGQLDNSVTGTGSLVKDGPGTFTITGGIGLSGGVTLNDGTIFFGGRNYLGLTSGGVGLGSGHLTINGGALEALNPGTLVNNATFAGDFALGRGITLSGNTTLAADVTLTTRNSSAAGNSTSTLSGPISGPHGITFTEGPNPTGTIILSGVSTYTGTTRINAGTVQLGAANRLAFTSPLTLAGGTFATGGFNQTLGVLTLGGNATIDFGSGTSALVFADSSGVAWNGTLSVLNYTTSTDSLKFGSSNTALTPAQLGRIDFGSGFTAVIDPDGFVTASAIPEPATYAALAGGAMLAYAAVRRRKLKQPDAR